MPTPNIHVMHEHPLMRAGLAALLRSSEWTITSDGGASNRTTGADLIVTDYETGLRVARTLKEAGAGQQVMIVTQRDRLWDVKRALELCVSAYVLEDADSAELQRAARYLLTGSRYFSPAIVKRINDSVAQEQLTSREQDVLNLLAKGLCNKRIARDLGIEVGTVKWHVRGVMAKLGAKARTQAVVTAAQLGLVGIDTPSLGGRMR